MNFEGIIVKGVGEAGYFTSLEWVQEQCLAKLGFKPFPGTLNVELRPEESAIIKHMKEEGLELVSPDPRFCNAMALPGYIGSIPGAVIIPSDEVNVHGSNIVEIICPLRIKDALGLSDGDRISFRIE